MNRIPSNPFTRPLLGATLLLLGATLPLRAQAPFDCGSNGSYGPINITADTTLTMPADGIFHCTTINVAAGKTLKFTPNPLNTPVYLLAQGDVTIAGTIDVSGNAGNSVIGGNGGPGGFAGGNPPVSAQAGGDGHGPGAGLAGTDTPTNFVGSASYGTMPFGVSNKHGVVYGNALLIPMVGGSGGGGMQGTGGSGGGGAILVASNSSISLSGSVVARGPSVVSSSYGGLGSGGAVRLLSSAVSGSGNVDVRGAINTLYTSKPSGGFGRIRVDCLNYRSLSLTYSGATSVGANMMVFPPNNPRLDITQAAGNDIAIGTSSAVNFILPQGNSPSQTVTVQASNFAAVVPIRVVLNPDNGPSVSYDAEIDNTTTNPATVTVPVVVPVNVQVHVAAWTR
jgi:hypothetical protein